MTDSSFCPSLALLAEQVRVLRESGKRIVHCHGVFDLLHIGHIRYLRGAAELGDVLVVTITPDRYVDKGPGRPAFHQFLRAEAVASLDCVTSVAVNEWPTAEETIRLLKPDVFAKGGEFRDLTDEKIRREAAAIAETGGELVFVEDIVFSSSHLINKYLASYSDECREYLNIFRKRYSLDRIFTAMDRFASLSVLLAGDAIIDEYVYCSPLGASSKDPVLALRHESSECFAGGAAAVANHLAQHVSSVTLCTVLGNDGQEAMFRDRLQPNVALHAAVAESSPTVRKIRIIDGYSFQKHLEIYHMDASGQTPECEAALSSLLAGNLPGADLVVAADFGNGCITSAQAASLAACDKFLAVNTQANAGNRGYHTIGRYGRADFVSLAGHEIRMEYRNSALTQGAMMADLRKRLKARYVLVTEGRSGCAIVDADNLQRAPSMAASVVDRVGAGDALFAVTLLCAKLGLPADLTAFLGNIAGSLAVESIGNAKAVTRDAMNRFITAILK
ncbi:PfkB family carbohydrate kinase [Desulfovibrio sp. OttesenSCG-928-A18]|nr:PfkB family carbohydrate kinase [Desulfovibrio sp. OttesenSCG-928-A18]